MFTLLLALASGTAFADQKIAVVDMQKAIQASDAGKKAKVELEQEFNKKKKELQTEEASIKKMQEDFQKKQDALNANAKQKKQAELQERFMKYQELLQKSQTDIQKREQEMSEPIIAKIRTVIQDIAKKKSYSLVLEKNQNVVLFSQDQDDLTSDVIGKIND